jgi:thymidylate kinase
MVEPYGFETIDASSSIEDVFKDLRRRVDGIIEGNGY